MSSKAPESLQCHTVFFVFLEHQHITVTHGATSLYFPIVEELQVQQKAKVD